MKKASILLSLLGAIVVLLAWYFYIYKPVEYYYVFFKYGWPVIEAGWMGVIVYTPFVLLGIWKNRKR